MEFEVKSRADKTTLRIAGELDALSACELRPTVNALASEELKNVEVDLSALRLLDSAGVGVIISLFKSVRSHGGRFAVSGVQGNPLSVFRTLRLDRVFGLDERGSGAIPKRHCLERSVDEVVETLLDAKQRGKPAWALVGAGCSVTAGIPDALGFVEHIKHNYPRHFERLEQDGIEPTYESAMGTLPPGIRKKVVAELVGCTRLNPTHVMLAWLLKNRFLARVLTTNFDDLLLRACSLFGVFPAIYDLTGTGVAAESLFGEPAIIHLHGQHAGIDQMHTREDFAQVTRQVERMLTSKVRQQPLITAGYSGSNDQTFETFYKVDSFAYGLYWTTYRSAPPEPRVMQLLEASRGAYFVKVADSDMLFYQLSRALGMDLTQLLVEPFVSTLQALRGMQNALPPDVDDRVDEALVQINKWLDAVPVELERT